MVLPTVRVGLHTLTNSIMEILHGQAQRLVSRVTLDLIKLTVKISHDIRGVGISTPL